MTSCYHALSMIRRFLPFVLLASAGAVGAILLKTPPEVPKSERPPIAAVVGVTDLVPQEEQVFVEGYGTVVPARETEVQPEVSGRIVVIHDQLKPGGLIGEGETLIEIDQADYEIALAEATAQVNVAGQEIEGLRAGVESLRGRARQIEVELEFLEWNKDRLGRLAAQNQAGETEAKDAQSRWASQRAALGALKAQVVEQERTVDGAIAKAAVAESRLAAARLALSRTSVRSPFAAIVLSESVEAGQLGGPQSTVAVLAATEEFWVEASIPVARLKDIRFSQGSTSAGSIVQVALATGEGAISRDGVVMRLLGQLDPRGRMAQIVISIHDPLNLHDHTPDPRGTILLGSYVHLLIDAGTLENVYVIPRYALRENSRLWVRDADHKLGIRNVDVVWRRQNDVLIRDGFKAGDQLVTTHLGNVVPGMPLKVREEIDGTPGSVSQRKMADVP